MLRWIDFEDNGDPIWAYMTQISMVNLHTLFKAIDVSQPQDPSYILNAHYTSGRYNERPA